MHYQKPLKVRTELLLQLVGLWELERQVTAATGAIIARMQGIASFAPLEGDFSRYEENGALMMEGAQPPVSFSRSYVYCAEPNGLAIFFDESPLRLFQRFTVSADGGASEGTAVHLCAPDTYHSLYRFELPQGFVITHQVEGPHKAYTIITSYRRSR